MSEVHEGWPARPAWADKEAGTRFSNADGDPVDEFERHFVLEVTAGASTIALLAPAA